MTTTFDCTLGGASLSALDGRICVLDIHHAAPNLRTSALPLHGGGQRILASTRESLTIRVRFAIHEEDPVRRQEVLDLVRAWAAEGGYLAVSDRPGQRLHVACTELPALSARDWPEELTLAFTSTHSPWWEDAEQTSVGGTGEMSLTVPGTAASAPVTAVILNTSASAVTSVTVNCANTHMTFEGVTLPSGGRLVLAYVDSLLSAKLDGASVLACMTMDSSDALLAPCGETSALSVTASETLYAFFNVRGRYL